MSIEREEVLEDRITDMQKEINQMAEREDKVKYLMDLAAEDGTELVLISDLQEVFYP